MTGPSKNLIRQGIMTATFALCLPIIVLAQTQREAWILGASSNEVQSFIDARSLKYEGSELSGWTLFYLKNGQLLDGRPLGYGLIKNYWNCELRTHRNPRSQYYFRSGEAAESYRNSDSAEEVLPSSLGAGNLEVACKNAPQKPVNEFSALLFRSAHPELYTIIRSGYHQSGKPIRDGQFIQYSDGQVARQVIIRGDSAYWAQEGDCATYSDGAPFVYISGKWEPIECSAGPRALAERARLQKVDGLGFAAVEDAIAFGKTILPWVQKNQRSRNTTSAPSKTKAKKR